MSPRHKEFDPSTALNEAVDVFWTQGYAATSVQVLVKHMGINRFSMYDTFGDKHELFMSACHRYSENRDEQRIEAFEKAKTGLESIRAFFKSVEESFADGEFRRGCLMTNAVVEMAVRDEEVRRWAAEFMKRLENAFAAALTRAKNVGEISEKSNPRELAQFLVCVLQGINVMGKAFPDGRHVHRLVRTAMAQLE
jgi:TetR/AcrR family transcriptional repressor of nem operon